MKAIRVKNVDGQPHLFWQDAPDLQPGPAEALVAVKATAVNRADLAQARGSYAPPPGVTDILGLEMAGEIVALGADVTGWAPGERVCGLLPGGGYASQATVHHGMLLRIPDEWSFVLGAAVPEVWYTAYVNLFLEGGLRAGETALIHAGASGVGTAAIQLAREAGATVIATAGSATKCQRCLELGAAIAINYRDRSFMEEAQGVTGEVNLILDPVGASFLEANLRLLAPKGRLVNIGSLSGQKAEIDLGLVLGKQLRIVGSLLRPRPLVEKLAITERFRQEVWPLLTNGRVTPVIDRIWPIEQAQDAHDHVRANQNVGKVILAVS
jgi:putative PIG3 family NAD(P)H quinone oxidoreductase